MASANSTRMKSTRSQQKRTKFEFYLWFMDLYTNLEILRLVEYVPFNRLRKIFEFHDRLSSRFPMVACLCITWLTRKLFTGFFLIKASNLYSVQPWISGRTGSGQFISHVTVITRVSAYHMTSTPHKRELHERKHLLRNCISHYLRTASQLCERPKHRVHQTVCISSSCVRHQNNESIIWCHSLCSVGQLFVNLKAMSLSRGGHIFTHM